jgi:ribosomal protein S18 acetylase RimI-like enzyme
MEIRCVDLNSYRRDLILTVADLYCQIFSEEPWNERLDAGKVVATMQEQFHLPSAVALSALAQNGEVLGFSWMYEIFKGDLKANTRYSLDLASFFEDGKRVFYFQEIGVKKRARCQGIGEKLCREVLEAGKRLGADIVVLSTNYNALPAKSLFRKVGFRDSGIVRPPAELGRTYWILEL